MPANAIGKKKHKDQGKLRKTEEQEGVAKEAAKGTAKKNLKEPKKTKKTAKTEVPTERALEKKNFTVFGLLSAHVKNPRRALKTKRSQVENAS